MKKKTAFIFPGQGAQYPGMGIDFYQAYPIAKRTFEEADDLLGRKLSDIILHGPNEVLLETRNSQTGIYVVSVAILRVIQELFPNLSPDLCGGLSLGEYTAATASGLIAFQECLPLVEHRGTYMNQSCEENKGTMAVILGLDGETVETMIREANLPHDLWAANFNCPGQVVISGTMKGVEEGIKMAKEKGAKRALPLQVYGAFHSGLMASAKKRLAPYVDSVQFHTPIADLVMNVSGTIVKDEPTIRRNLIEQVTSPVKWEQGIRTMETQSLELYMEMGPGKTLAGFNKRIGVSGTTVSVEKVEDLAHVEKTLKAMFL